MTRTGDVLGTPASMSPEQAAGESPGRLDAHGLEGVLLDAAWRPR